MYAEIIDSLDAEERESSVLNDTNDAFVAKEVKSFVAEALSDVENDEIKILRGYLSLSKKKEKLDYINKCDTVSWDLMEQGSDGTYKKGSVTSRISELQRMYEFPEDSVITSYSIHYTKLYDDQAMVSNERDRDHRRPCDAGSYSPVFV